MTALLNSASALACNKIQEKLPTQEIDFSELKSGQHKIILWDHLPVAIINKPKPYKPINNKTTNKAATKAELALRCSVGGNGFPAKNLNPSRVSVLLLLPPPIGCAGAKIIIPPEKAPTDKAAELLKKTGGIIYDSCAGYIFDLDGLAIGQESDNMQIPKHKITGTTLTLGQEAN